MVVDLRLGYWRKLKARHVALFTPSRHRYEIEPHHHSAVMRRRIALWRRWWRLRVGARNMRGDSVILGNGHKVVDLFMNIGRRRAHALPVGLPRSVIFVNVVIYSCTTCGP